MIYDENHKKVTKPREVGSVVIKLPMPPSFMQTLWGSDQAFVQKYLSDNPGFYTTGDAGFLDENGYLHIMTRMDDVINVAGHRLSTGSLEEVINNHKLVVESAVVGWNDEIRGEIPIAFVILRGADGDINIDAKKQMMQAINDKIRKNVGAIAKLEEVFIVQKLPKTRSGKILRGTIKKIANQTEYTVPATIEDYAPLEIIEKIVKEWTKVKKERAKL